MEQSKIRNSASILLYSLNKVISLNATMRQRLVATMSNETTLNVFMKAFGIEGSDEQAVLKVTKKICDLLYLTDVIREDVIRSASNQLFVSNYTEFLPKIKSGLTQILLNLGSPWNPDFFSEVTMTELKHCALFLCQHNSSEISSSASQIIDGDLKSLKEAINSLIIELSESREQLEEKTGEEVLDNIQSVLRVIAEYEEMPLKPQQKFREIFYKVVGICFMFLPSMPEKMKPCFINVLKWLLALSINDDDLRQIAGETMKRLQS